MDTISVIIPVFNVEQYLDSCIASVAGQTYKNLEIILVDDGSTDSSSAICDSWAEKDSRIRVIHKINGGLGDARNTGAKEATGSYIGFVDSDDVISPDMYTVLINLLKKYNADMIQCGMFRFCDFPLKEFPENGETGVEVLSREQAVSKIYEKNGISSTCPNALLRSRISKVTPFDTGVLNEDVMWIYRVISASERILLTGAAFYGYYQRAGSIMNSVYSVRHLDAIKMSRNRADDIRINYPGIYPVAENSFAGLCMYHYQKLCRMEKKPEHIDIKKVLLDYFRKSDFETIYSVCGLKYRLWYKAFNSFPGLTCRIRNLLKIGL